MHLAQVDIGRIPAPLDSDTMHGFTSRLDEIDALADDWPGFVWRLQGGGDSATDLRPFGDDTILVNMSVWEDLEALRDHVYRSDHLALLRARRPWFEPMKEAFTALWWVPAGHVPTAREAWERITHPREHGPTTHAFAFGQAFGAPEPTPSWALWRVAPSPPHPLSWRHEAAPPSLRSGDAWRVAATNA